MRITSYSNTLPGNMFSNVIYLPQSAIIPNIFGNISGNKSNIYQREWLNFDRENVTIMYFSVDCEDLLKIDHLNTDNSTQMYLNGINMFLDTYVPLKELINTS